MPVSHSCSEGWPRSQLVIFKMSSIVWETGYFGSEGRTCTLSTARCSCVASACCGQIRNSLFGTCGQQIASSPYSAVTQEVSSGLYSDSHPKWCRNCLRRATKPNCAQWIAIEARHITKGKMSRCTVLVFVALWSMRVASSSAGTAAPPESMPPLSSFSFVFERKKAATTSSNWALSFETLSRFPNPTFWSPFDHTATAAGS